MKIHLKSIIVFLLLASPPLAGAQPLQTLCSFSGTDGANPYGALALGRDGKFYGTTAYGGITNSPYTEGRGTVFKVTTNGALARLSSFNGTNGNYPYAGLMQGSDGNLYGTTYTGGSREQGTVFKVTTTGALTTLVSLNGTNGTYPHGGLVEGGDGNFYGTTVHGGAGYGTVFKVTPSGTLTTLVSFNGNNGLQPESGLVQGSDGNFYGTTSSGGAAFGVGGNGYGTVFKMTTNGMLTTLVSFANTNGAGPYAALALGSNSSFYGTTPYGGTTNSTYPHGMGTVFKVTTNGELTTLVSFEGTNGAFPYAALALGSNGSFYGTTAQGGITNSTYPSGMGTLFQMTTNGELTTLISFGGTNGAYPFAALALGRDGNFYGTTSAGGGGGKGTVFCLWLFIQLNVTATAGGSVVRDPDLPVYAAGSLVTLTATPAVGYGFIRWAGDATGSTNPLTVTMSTNKSITAVFASTALTLSRRGAGTITKVPDQPFYAVGEPVTLAATAGRWHVFSTWLDGLTNNPRIVTIGESNAYTAVFTATTPLDTVTIGGVSRLAPVGMPAVVVDEVFILTPSASARGSALVTLSTTFPGGTLFYTLDGTDPAQSGTIYSGPLTVRKSSGLRTLAYDATFSQSVAGDPLGIIILPTLTGLTSGGGSLAIAPPSGAYFSNELATVTATAKPGWTFLQWLGDATGSNPAVNLSMTRSKTVRAVFGTTLTTAAVGGGSVVASPVSPLYPYGSQVRLTPVPTTGNYHAQWANAAAGRTTNPLTFTVTNANPTVTAVFASLGSTQTNALTVIPDGRGQVTLSPPGNRYRLNTNVVLQATAEAGQEFLGWSGAASGSLNPLTVTMNSNKVITASFTKRPWLQGEGNPELLSQDGFRLTLIGEFGAAYQFFGSPDLGAWLPLVTVTNTWGTVQFTDSEAATNTHRFYRARSVE